MGRVELFHSRRTKYNKCLFWVRDERVSIGDASKIVYNVKPSGLFYAKPVSVKTNQMNAISGAWSFDTDYITIETDDHVEDLKRDCIVKFDESIWIVDSVQKEIHLKESEFSKYNHYKSIIALRKG